jgi:hypothetical protein
MIDLEWSLARPWGAKIPLLDHVMITDGRAPIQFYERSAGYQTDNPAIPVDVKVGRKWVEANVYSAEKIYALSSGRSVTALGVRGYLYNTNTLNFYWVFKGNATLPMIQATPEYHGNSVEAYNQLFSTGDGASACQLITASGSVGEIKPAIIEENIVQAARKAGFSPVDNWDLPDKRAVTLWRREKSNVPCT